MFYLTTHSTHFIYGYGRHMVKDHSDSERRNPDRHIGYSYRLTARVLLYAPSHRQDNTYHGLCPVVEHWLEREIARHVGRNFKVWRIIFYACIQCVVRHSECRRFDAPQGNSIDSLYSNYDLFSVYYSKDFLTICRLVFRDGWREGRKEMFYLTTHSTHFIYGYMESDIW